MQLVLFIPDFVLADQPEILRACPVRIAAELCRRIGAAVGRCHVVAQAPAIQPAHVCADKDPTMVGHQAIPEAMAIGLIRARDLGEVRLEVHSATSGGAHGVDGPVDTLVFATGTYEGAIAANELREAFLHDKQLPKTTDYTKIRHDGFCGVLINLRLTPRRKLDQFGFAVGLPLYDAAGFVIDLRRYSVLSGIGRDVTKPAAKLLKQLAL